MPPNMNKEGELVVTADKQRENKASRHLEEQSQKVAELYNSGTNCDKAVLLILQEILKLPPEKWGIFGNKKAACPCC